MSELTIIVPAYNEEGRIGKTLASYLDYYKDKSVSFLVVVNGSTDRTFEIVEGFHQQYPHRMDVILEPRAIGKGGAVVRGVEHSETPWVAFVDADGATAPAELQKLLDRRGDADVIIASRFVDGSTVTERTFVRRLASRWFRLFVRWVFQMPIKDTQCGAKCFDRKKCAPLFASLKTANMAFDVELLWRAFQAELRILEVPTVWVEQQQSALLGSPLKLIRQGWAMTFTLLRLRFSIYGK